MSGPLSPGFYRCVLVVDGVSAEADVIPAPGETAEEAAAVLAEALFPGGRLERYDLRPRPTP